MIYFKIIFFFFSLFLSFHLNALIIFLFFFYDTWRQSYWLLKSKTSIFYPFYKIFKLSTGGKFLLRNELFFIQEISKKYLRFDLMWMGFVRQWEEKGFFFYFFEKNSRNFNVSFSFHYLPINPEFLALNRKMIVLRAFFFVSTK